MFLFVLGLGLCALAILGGIQLQARQQFLSRGWVRGFPQPVEDTGMPRLCVNVALEHYAAQRMAWALDMVEAGGFRWIRQRFVWAEIEPLAGEFHWDAWDQMIAEAESRDLRLIAVLDGAPEWAGDPLDPQAFARFAGALADRYGESLTYYQIWHNPNLGESWGGYANAYAYAELLAGAASAIRQADPDARIILGALAPTAEVGARNYAEDVFLEMLYVAGAAGHFDVLSVQPYGFTTGPEDRRVGLDVLNFSRAILAHEALAAQGEAHKAVWVSHFGWNSKPADWPGPPSIWGSVDARTQAAYTVAALDRAEREWSWMGVMCLNTFQPRPEMPRPVPDAEEHWGFALVSPEGQPRPVYEAVQAWAARPRRAMPGTYPASTSLATFEGDWTLGPLGADIGQTGDRVTLPFEGTGIALTVRRGPYRAFLFVTVDGQPAPALPRDRQGRSYVVLYDPLAAVVTVPLAEDLPYGPHTVEVVAERGWDQWALSDWRVAHPPDTTAGAWGLVAFASLGALGATMLMLGGRQLVWQELRQGLTKVWARLREWAQVILSLILSAIYLFAAWQTMMDGHVFRRLGEGNDLVALALAAGLFYFSSWTLLSIAAGVLVTLIVVVDPALGLALTTFAAPLYMHPLSLLGKSFSLAELVLLPTLVGWGVRVMAHYAPPVQFPKVLSFLWPLHRSEQRSHRDPVQFSGTFRKFLKAILAFILIAGLSTVFAAQRREALRELRLVILEPVLFYFALVTLPLDKRERWRIIDAWALSAGMVAIVGLIQYFLLGDVITAEGGIRRLHSVYGSPNNVGLYLGRIVPVLIAVVMWGEDLSSDKREDQAVHQSWRSRALAFLSTLVHSPRRVLYAAMVVPVGLALLLSFSRGAIVLGVPAALLTLGLLAGAKWRRVTVILLILGGVALLPLLSTPRFVGMFDLSAGTTSFRLSLWHSAWGMFKDHPALGVGPDNFLYAYRTRYVLPTAWEEFNLSHPHNVVMDFISRLGVPGLLIFIWLQVLFWTRALPMRNLSRSANRVLALGIMGSMANFLGHGLVDASYFVIDLAYVFFLSLAVVTWLDRVPASFDDFEVDLADTGLDVDL